MLKKTEDVSPLALALAMEAVNAAPKRRSYIQVDQEALDNFSKSNTEEVLPGGRRLSPLTKSILNVLNGEDGSVERLAFESDPTTNTYNGLYKQKLRLLPDKILKRIAIQDDLVACIVGARQNQISAFGRPRPDRFSTGFVIEERAEVLEQIDAIKDENEKTAKKKWISDKIAEVTKRMMTCGSTKGWSDDELLTFPQYLLESTRSAIVCGRIATEVIRTDGPDGKKHFHSFRVIDAGTIYRTVRLKGADKAAAQVRKAARKLLEELNGKKIDPERYVNDEYAWVQVINETPYQAFTAEECLVHQFYPVPDIELDGYPVTPLDTAITAVTTHINITTHNKLYFQTGRATRGMLVIKSENANSQVISRIRQQFTSQINSVNNAWRMPCFGIGPDDEVEWMPIDSGGRDMEYQYLADMNARVILSAFQMSPEELPGWAYLSRGTNNQALSESNQEYRLEAHRDLGIRPLLSNMEDFLNHAILPLFDEELAKVAVIKLVGLDADTPEKEAVRLQEDQNLHLTMDEMLEKVDKKPVGKEWAGDLLFNPGYLQHLDKYYTVADIKEHFMGWKPKDEADRARWDYARDPFFQAQTQRLDQLQGLQAQMQQMQGQMQQMAQLLQQHGLMPQDPNGGGQPGGGGAPPGGGDAGGGAPPPQGGGQPAPPAEDLTRSLDQAVGSLSKSEVASQSPAKMRLVAHQRLLVEHAMGEWDEDLKSVKDDIIKVAKRFKPKAA